MPTVKAQIGEFPLPKVPRSPGGDGSSRKVRAAPVASGKDPIQPTFQTGMFLS